MIILMFGGVAGDMWGKYNARIPFFILVKIKLPLLLQQERGYIILCKSHDIYMSAVRAGSLCSILGEGSIFLFGQILNKHFVHWETTFSGCKTVFI